MFTKLSVVALALVSAVSALNPVSSGAGLDARDVPAEVAHNVLRRDPVAHKNQVMARSRRLIELVSIKTTSLEAVGLVYSILNTNVTVALNPLEALIEVKDIKDVVVNEVITKINTAVGLLDLYIGTAIDLIGAPEILALIPELKAQVASDVNYTQENVEELVANLVIHISKTISDLRATYASLSAVDTVLVSATAEIDTVLGSLLSITALLNVVVISTVGSLVGSVLSTLRVLGFVQIITVLKL